ncbi:uncharacterized protein LOC110246429 [Exaiptasia diaphana]|uniref:Reverse transcriptase domain-containing protein n=1 Tax=Exaiptasia diaphana TaxID=2652724 RepID=A0A913YRF6_EXADI|nr:uncharacterized protein LOC110246429 [Exaiptasia diaphana]
MLKRKSLEGFVLLTIEASFVRVVLLSMYVHPVKVIILSQSVIFVAVRTNSLPLPLPVVSLPTPVKLDNLKTDIKHAFCIIPIHPEDYHLLGMQWKGSYYYDKCMPMGCASSCKTFEAFSSALEWIAKHHLEIRHIVHLLDDFFICESSKVRCGFSLKGFLALCDYVGIPMAPEKTVGPSTVLSFAGIELDTVASEARLPLDKVHDCSNLIFEFLHKKKTTLHDLQSLIGKLNFACKVVVPGRAFLRRLIDLTVGVNHPKHLIRLSRGVKTYLEVWYQFLQHYNGSSIFLEEVWEDSFSLQLHTDSSGALGFGAIFGRHWCYGQ